MVDAPKEKSLFDRIEEAAIGVGGTVTGSLMSHEAYIAKYTPALARVGFGAVGPAMIVGGVSLAVDALAGNADAAENAGVVPIAPPAPSSTMEKIGAAARFVADFLTGGAATAAQLALQGGESTRQQIQQLIAERDAKAERRQAKNVEGAKYLIGQAGDEHPAASRMYEKLDRARFSDVLLRGNRALESIRRSRQPAAYLNDAAKSKAERPAPAVRAPAASPTSSPPPGGDGQTASYVRAGKNGGIVQVQSYTTPTRRR